MMFKIRNSLKCIILAYWFVAVFCLNSQNDLPLSISIDKNPIYVGDSATLTIEFTSERPTTPPQIPEIDGLQIDYIGTSQQISIINGSFSSSTSFNYLVTPLKTGVFTIPSFKITINRKTYTTKPLNITVLQQTQQPQSPQQQSAQEQEPQQQLAIIQLLPSKQEVYVGEVFPIEIQLLYLDAQNIKPPEIKGDNFSFAKSFDTSQKIKSYNGRQYRAVIFKTTASAIRTGELVLGPAECELYLPVRRRPTGFWDPFSIFDDIYYQPVRIKSNTVKIKSLNLPPLTNDLKFSGAIGSFTMNSSAAPTNVNVGDPITLKLEISGHGSIETFTPTFNTNYIGFKFYPPNSNFSPQDKLGFNGTRTFEQVIIPEKPGQYPLPTIAFTYFDPDKKSYITITNQTIYITVNPNQSTTTTYKLNTRTNQEPITADIVPDKRSAGSIRSIQASMLVLQPQFWLINSIPLIAFLITFLWIQHHRRMESNPMLARRIKTQKYIKRALKELFNYAKANDSDNFYSTLFRLLQELIGEKTLQPSSSITENAIDDFLRPLGLSDIIVEDLHTLFKLCNQAKYAQSPSSQVLTELYTKALSVINEIQKLPYPTNKNNSLK